MRRVKKFPVFILFLTLTAVIVSIVLLFNRTYTIDDFYEIDNVGITSVKVVNGENGKVMSLDETIYIDEFKQFLSQLELKRKYIGGGGDWQYDFSPYENDACGLEIIFYSDKLCKIGNKKYKIVSRPQVSYDAIVENLAEINFNINFEYDDTNTWTLLDLKNSGFESRQDFEDKARSYIFKTMRLLDMNRWYYEYGTEINELDLKISFASGTIVNDSNVFVDGDNRISAAITFDKKSFENGSDALVYEVSKIILKSASYSLEEGISEYLQDKVEKNTGSVSYGINPDDYAINVFEHSRKLAGTNEEAYLNMIEVIYSSVGKRGESYPVGLSPTGVGIWRTLNYSFVNFLVQRYGFDKIAGICKDDNTTIGYENIQNGGLDAIRANWIGYFSAYQPKISYAQMTSIIDKITSGNR